VITSAAQKPKTASQTPESLGISSTAILNFIEAAEKERPDELHSFMLLRHGQVAAQGWWGPFGNETPHMLFSLSKSFTSTAIGIAQAEGLLNINDRVISFFPEQTPAEPSSNLQAMRIRDLLSMSTGHNDDATDRMRKDSSWVKKFLSLPVEHKPGTHFVYNSAATYMLSAIIQKKTGQTMLEYLTPRLFEPLGIPRPTWEKSPEGISVGGWGLMIRTQDIASLGQLYLQKGVWKGKQLIPAAWVEEATKKQTSNGSNPDSDWEQGYGYQFWRTRYDLYRGDGAFGQFCIVFPKQDAVLAITCGTTSMGSIMNLVWKYLLPALSEKPLKENQNGFNALQTKLGSLKLSVLKGNAKPSDPSFTSAGKYSLNPNDENITAISFDLTSSTSSVTLEVNGKPSVIPFGNGALKASLYPWAAGEDTPVAASGGWIAHDTLQVRMYLYQTPYALTYTIGFNGKEIKIFRTSNVNMGAATKVELTGRRN
ncbi:MAG: serine hydrolase, partial [Chitinophagaceae bacterium]|nr:serine hydrolase [Chitinophagaceae bacterium]